MDPEKNSLNFIFPTKYVIPKSLKFSHWPSKSKKKPGNNSTFGLKLLHNGLLRTPSQATLGPVFGVFHVSPSHGVVCFCDDVETAEFGAIFLEGEELLCDGCFVVRFWKALFVNLSCVANMFVTPNYCASSRVVLWRSKTLTQMCLD